MASPNENDLHVTAAAYFMYRTWWMFCLAACDISCDEHHPYLQVVVSEATEHRKMHESAPAAEVLKASPRLSL